VRDGFPRLLATLSLTLVGSSAAGQDKDIFAIRTALVSVKDSDGAPVPGLTAGEFEVREAGVSRDVTELAWDDRGREVTVLIDTSLVFQNEVLQLRRGLQAFLSGVRAEDRITLYEYGQRPRLLVGPTGDRLALQSAIGKLYAWSGEGAYLLDMIAETARRMRSEERPEEQPPVVVIVGGSGPDLSHTSYIQARELGEKSGAEYHAVVFDSGASSTLARHEIEGTLHELTEKRGGTLTRVLTPTALEPELGRLGAVLLQPRYRVSFLTEASHPTSSKTLSVSVKREGVRAELLRLLPGEKKVTPSNP
jgi:hypothetical protein